ncbi:hypothetical protein V8E36_007924 [Tilletia maclaganii]
MSRLPRVPTSQLLGQALRPARTGASVLGISAAGPSRLLISESRISSACLPAMALSRSPVSRHFSHTRLVRRQDAREDGAGAAGSLPDASAAEQESTQQPLGEIKPRLSLTFTCAASGCGHRSSHEFSKQAYTRGVVIVQCPSCQSRHLIADHLGWFTETADEPRTVEEMVAAKGEQVQRGFKYSDGKGGHAIEIEPEDDVNSSPETPSQR